MSCWPRAPARRAPSGTSARASPRSPSTRAGRPSRRPATRSTTRVTNPGRVSFPADRVEVSDPACDHAPELVDTSDGSGPDATPESLDHADVGPLLHPRAARQPRWLADLWAVGLRDERLLGAVRVAGRGRDRDPRHESAIAHPRPPVARLHPRPEPGGPPARPAHARRHARPHHRVSRSALDAVRAWVLDSYA